MLVTSAQALCQKVVPQDVLRQAVVTLRKEQELDVTELASRLDALGYIRVPVVEDPGGFSIRGGLVDLWSADADAPCRLRPIRRLIMGLKTFDPESQRTTGELDELTLSPARETILTPEISQRARERLRELCDACNTPSSRARQLIEELVTGRNTFGVSGLLPAFYPLDSVWNLIPGNALIIADDSPRVAEAMNLELTRVENDWQQHQGEPYYPPESLYTSEQEVSHELSRRTVLCCSSGFVQGQSQGLQSLELAASEPINLVQSTHDDLERAVKLARSSQGKRAALDPLVERLELWKEHGIETSVMCRTVAQARRLDSLLKHRDVPTRLDQVAHDGDLDPNDAPSAASEASASAQTPWLHIGVGKLSRGLIAPLDALVFLTEEEVFGHRAHGAKTRSRKKPVMRSKTCVHSRQATSWCTSSMGLTLRGSRKSTRPGRHPPRAAGRGVRRRQVVSARLSTQSGSKIFVWRQAETRPFGWANVCQNQSHGAPPSARDGR